MRTTHAHNLSKYATNAGPNHYRVFESMFDK